VSSETVVPSETVSSETVVPSETVSSDLKFGISMNGVPIGLTKGVSTRFLVSPHHVGFIIGKGGGNVKRIRDNTSTQIIIQDADEKSMGYPFFLVRGLFKKNVSDACNELAIMGNKAGGMNSGYGVPLEEEYIDTEVKYSYLIVHPDHVGMMVGKGGFNIKRLSRENGAFIYAQKGNKESGGCPWFEIKGLWENNIECAYFALLAEAQRVESIIPRFYR